MQVCCVALLPLQSHPAKGRAACQEGSRGWTPNRTGLGGPPHYPANLFPAPQPRLTVHASEVRLAKDSSYPELLGIHVRAHQGVARWHLDHGFQLAAHPVGLWDVTPSSAQALRLPLLLSSTGAAFLWQPWRAGTAFPMPSTLTLKVKTGFNTRMGHRSLGYSPQVPPAWKKGSLWKDRNQCFTVFFSFHQVLKLRSFPSSKVKAHQQEKGPSTSPSTSNPSIQPQLPFPTQAAPTSPKHTEDAPKHTRKDPIVAIPGHCWPSATWAPPPGG